MSKLSTLILAVAATLALAPSAAGKGGGGASCASIVNFTVAPNLATSYSVNNGCVDERMSAVALDVRNNATGFTGRAVNMLPYGLSSYSSAGSSTVTPGVSYTFTVTVYAPNGKVADTRTTTVTA